MNKNRPYKTRGIPRSWTGKWSSDHSKHIMREREEAKKQEANLKAALKKEKEEERRRERDRVSGWSSNQMNNKQF